MKFETLEGCVYRPLKPTLRDEESFSLFQEDAQVVGEDPQGARLAPDAPQAGRAGEEQTHHRHQGLLPAHVSSTSPLRFSDRC